MKRIGILTYHKSINYGSVLQAWSLQQKLLKEGYDVEIIDYTPEKYNDMYDVPSTRSFRDRVKWTLFHKIYSSLKQQTKLFSLFRMNELILSNEKYNIDSSYSFIRDNYDVFICGSDQIWNVNAIDCDPIFFLPFKTNARKISYAASINVMDFREEKYKKNLKSWIVDFDYISCRERTGTKKLLNFLDNKKNVVTMPDPTIFSNAEDFNRITSPRIVKESYIFLYYADFFGHTDYLLESVKRIKKILNLPVYTILMTKSPKQIHNLKKNGIKVVLDKTSPSDFVSLIKYADLVISNSFHGTAISLIMEKKVVSLNDLKYNGDHRNDERITNILNEYEIGDRYLKLEDIDSFDFSKKIDYGVINEKRKEIASNSFRWLKNAIEE